MYVYVCVCMCMYVYACTYACMYACVYACVYAWMDACNEETTSVCAFSQTNKTQDKCLCASSLPPWVPHMQSLRKSEEFVVTNLQNKGLISADRGTKATLVRTIPSSFFKSYTKDLLCPIFELVFQHRLNFL